MAKAAKSAKSDKKTKLKAQPKKAKKSSQKKTPKPLAKSAKKKVKAAPKTKVAAKAKPKSASKPSKTSARPIVQQAPKKSAVKVSVRDLAGLFTPLDNRILVEKTGVAERTPGGLYIPDTVSADDRPTQGAVVAVGRGHVDKKGRLHPLDVKVGDRVMFNAFSGSQVKINSQEYLCLREDEILAVVKG